MSKLSPSIEDDLTEIDSEWNRDGHKRYYCTFCGRPYADKDGGAIRGHNPTYPARCYEKLDSGKRCPGQVLEVDNAEDGN